jgi:hypothetical protein
VVEPTKEMTMNSFTPDVARLLQRDRVVETAARQRRIDARRGAKRAQTAVLQQRRGSRLRTLLVPQTGVRVSTR